MFLAARLRDLALVLACLLALLLPGVGSSQDDSPPPDKPSTGKDRTKPKQADRQGQPGQTPKKKPHVEEDEDELQPFAPRIMPGFDPEEIQQIQREILRMQREMIRQMQQGGVGGGMFMLPGMAMEDSRQARRLGIHVDRPSEVLIDQLDLPRGQGQVVREVQSESAAARAGIKTNDILLEIGGAPISSNVQSFRKQIDKIKANEAVAVVVLRKGKRETLKGLTLPRARPRPQEQEFPAMPQLRFGIQGFQGGNGPILQQGATGAMTSTVRNGSSFTTHHTDGSLVITIKGKVVDGKATVSEIRIQDENDSQRYTSVDKAPEEYQDRIKKLIELSEKGKTPAADRP
jgi:hypothetical protein